MVQKLKKLPKRSLIILSFLSWTTLGFSDSVVTKESTLRNKITVDTFVTHIRLKGDPVSGTGLQANINVAIHDRFGLGVMFAHALTFPASTLFIQVSLEAKWALTGALISKEQTISAEGKPIIKTETGNDGGLMLHGFLHEYVVNRAYLMQRYSGLGTAISYEFPSKTNLNFRLGFRSDYSLREIDSFLGFQAFGGLSLRF